MSDLVKYFQHIKELCDCHGIKIMSVVPVLDSAALQDQNKTMKFIMSPMPRTELDYIVTLHEIGHIVAEGGADQIDKWKAELIANRWAFSTSKWKPSEDTLKEMANALNSYDPSKSFTECMDIIRELAR